MSRVRSGLGEGDGLTVDDAGIPGDGGRLDLFAEAATVTLPETGSNLPWLRTKMRYSECAAGGWGRYCR